MKIQDDYRVMRQLNKEQKQEKRNIENELLRERAKTDQLQDIIRIFGLQNNGGAATPGVTKTP